MIVRENGKNSFKASGGTILGTESLKLVEGHCDLCAAEGVAFTLENGITDVEIGFFDSLPTLMKLSIADTEIRIELTD